MMTPEERKMIQAVGKAMLAQLFPSNAVSTFLYGLSMPIFAWSMLFLIKRKSWVQMAIVSLGFAASTALFTLTMTGGISIVKVIASHATSPLLDRILDYNSRSNRADIAGSWIDDIIVPVNDCFIVWRAWFFFRRIQTRQWALRVLCSFCLLSVVTMFVAAVLQSTFLGAQNVDETSTGQAIDAVSDLAQVMSLVTNCAATACIWWILRGHLNTLRRNNRWQGQKLFNVWRILALLVETGAIYGVIQLIALVLSFLSFPDESSAAFARAVIITVYYSVSTVYPALTFYLIHGPFSIAGIHDSVMSLDIASQERPAQDLA